MPAPALLRGTWTTSLSLPVLSRRLKSQQSPRAPKVRPTIWSARHRCKLLRCRFSRTRRSSSPGIPARVPPTPFNGPPTSMISGSISTPSIGITVKETFLLSRNHFRRGFFFCVSWVVNPADFALKFLKNSAFIQNKGAKGADNLDMYPVLK